MASDAGTQGSSSGRPLTQDELQVLGAILAYDFEGASELRPQLEKARVLRNWSPQSVSFDMAVPLDVPRAPIEQSILPLEIAVNDESDAFIGELIVWLADGRLAGLEYAWVTDEPPLALPLPSQLVISRHEDRGRGR